MTFFNHCIMNKCYYVTSYVNKRSKPIEVADQLTVLVNLAVFIPSQNQEKSESALSQLSRGSNNTTWARKSGQADPPETLTYKWLAALHALIGPFIQFSMSRTITLHNGPVGCGCRIHRLYLCRGVRLFPTIVQNMTLKI